LVLIYHDFLNFRLGGHRIRSMNGNAPAGEQQAMAWAKKSSSVDQPARRGSADEDGDLGSESHLLDDDTCSLCCGHKAWLYPELPWGAPPECDTDKMRGVSPSPPRLTGPTCEARAR